MFNSFLQIVSLIVIVICNALMIKLRGFSWLSALAIISAAVALVLRIVEVGRGK